MILRIILPYALFAGLWILFSDRLLEALRLDPATQIQWSIYKDWGFVFVTTLLLSLLLRAECNVRSQVQEARPKSEERLRLIGDNLPESYVYQFTRKSDGAPRFLHVSAGMERLHGLRMEDVLRDADLLRRRIDPEQAAALSAAEEASFRSLTDFSLELRMEGIDGQWRWIRLSSHPHLAPDGSVVWDGVATDITERKQAEERIRQLNEDLRRHAAELEHRVAERTAELAVARELRHNAALSGIPIVAVTSYAMMGDKEKALAAGCNGYLEKPINPETFVADVEHYLSLPGSGSRS